MRRRTIKIFIIYLVKVVHKCNNLRSDASNNENKNNDDNKNDDNNKDDDKNNVNNNNNKEKESNNNNKNCNSEDTTTPNGTDPTLVTIPSEEDNLCVLRNKFLKEIQDVEKKIF